MSMCKHSLGHRHQPRKNFLQSLGTNRWFRSFHFLQTAHVDRPAQVHTSSGQHGTTLHKQKLLRRLFNVIPVIEDDDSNTRFIPDLVDALREAEIRVPHRCKIHPSAGEDDIKKIISSLKEKWTSVFVVRMSYQLALRFFQHAKDEGMMGQGFVWIAAYGLTDVFDIVGSPAFDVMQGVIGLKPYVNDTKLQN